MKKINFGKSITKVGAVTIYNFRVRTNNPRLHFAIEKWLGWEYPHQQNTPVYGEKEVFYQVSMMSKGYRMYDVSSLEFENFNNAVNELRVVLLSEKINKLKDKYGDMYEKAEWQGKVTKKAIEVIAIMDHYANQEQVML